MCWPHLWPTQGPHCTQESGHLDASKRSIFLLPVTFFWKALYVTRMVFCLLSYVTYIICTGGCAIPVTMSISHISGERGGLGSESTGTCETGSFVDFSWLPITETPRMAQHCGPTAALAVVSRDPTFAPWTPATSPENNHRVHLSLVCPRRGLVTRACVREGGKCPVPGAADRWLADRTEPAPRPPCQQTHTGFSLSRLGRVAVPGALSHARHLTCKCVHL